MNNFFERTFRLEANKTTFKTEIIAGITTFLTMAYIIAVNPNMVSEAIGEGAKGALVTSTCLASAFACILMAFYANLPFALAPGMGLNAFFTYSVVLGMGIPWQVALGAIFVEGIIFILLSVTNIRSLVVEAIPYSLKIAVTVGIGLFVAFIGFVDAGIVIAEPSTLVKMGELTTPTVIFSVIGLLLIIILLKKRVKGALLFGIALSTIIAWIYAYMNPLVANSYGIYAPSGNIFEIQSLKPILFKLDLSYLSNTSKILSFATIVFTFLFVDFFDTLGTVVGVAAKGNMLDKDGNFKGAGKALLVDAVATTGGALVGSTTITTFVESSAGVAEGGRTGLTALTTGILFIIAMFFSPIFMVIPSCAIAPALIVVGFMMMENITKINFGEITEGFPAFITIAAMPLTYSIGDGLTLGVLTYVFINLFNNFLEKDKTKKNRVSMVMVVLAVVFIVKIIITGMLE